jgi:hypothetical protein
MSYIIPIGDESFMSAENGWFSVSTMTRDLESLDTTRG